MEAPAARHLLKAASAETAELAGTRTLKILVMVNTRKKFGGNELALAGAVKEDLACSGSSPLNKSDQVISANKRDGGMKVRASDPGHKLKETSCLDDKNPNPQASSDKLQAPSRKHQAPSRKRQAP